MWRTPFQRSHRSRQAGLRLLCEQLEDRRLLASLFATDEILNPGLAGFYITELQPGERVTVTAEDADGRISRIGGLRRADINGLAYVRDLLQSSIDALGPMAITAAADSGTASVQATVVDNHDAVFSDLGLIGPDQLTAGHGQFIFSQGWWPRETVRSEVTLPGGRVLTAFDIAYDNGFSHDRFWISHSTPAGTATYVATGDESGLSLTHQFTVNASSTPTANNETPPAEEDEVIVVPPTPGVPTLIVPQNMMADDRYDALGTGLPPDTDVYLTLVQGSNVFDLDDSETDGDGEFDERFTVPEYDDGLVNGPAIVYLRDEDGHLFDSAAVHIAGIVPQLEWEFPANFTEGDAFTVAIEEGFEFGLVEAFIVDESAGVLHTFPDFQLDDRGDGTMTLRMPRVLDDGLASGQITIVVPHADSYQSTMVNVNEGLRLEMDLDNVMEGDSLMVTLRNAPDNTPFTLNLIYNDDESVHQWHLQTNSAGKFNACVAVPHVLPPSVALDGFKLQATIDGQVARETLTIREGLRVVAADNTKEGNPIPAQIRQGKGVSAVEIEWWHDGTLVHDDPTIYQTNGSGEWPIAGQEPVVPDLITNGAKSDLFTVRILHQDNWFELPVTVYDTITPDPGQLNADSVADDGNAINSQAGSLIEAAERIAGGASYDDAIVDLPNEVKGFQSLGQVMGYVAYNVRNNIPFLPQLNTASLPDLTQLATLIGVQRVADDVPANHDSSLDIPSNALVVTLFGANQVPGADHTEGMAIVTNRLSNRGYNTLPTFSGYNSIGADPSYGPDDALADAQADITSYVNANVTTDIVLVGYSWGGGLAQVLSPWVTTPGTFNHSVELVGVAYIDAVDHASFAQENAFPTGAQAVLNLFQDAQIGDDVFLLNGGELSADGGLDDYDDGPYLGTLKERFVDDGHPSLYDHYNIDTAFAGEVVDWVDDLLLEAVGQ